MARPKWEWLKVKAAYLRGEGSLPEIAKKFGIPERTVTNRAQAEHWGDIRREIGGKAEAKAKELAVESTAQVLARHASGAKWFQRRLRRKARDASEENLSKLATAYARLVPTERLALGLSPNEPVIGGAIAGSGTVTIVVKGPNSPAGMEPEKP
jgi:hypothetical protein